MQPLAAQRAKEVFYRHIVVAASDTDHMSLDAILQANDDGLPSTQHLWLGLWSYCQT
jgi:hypothetical protein